MLQTSVSVLAREIQIGKSKMQMGQPASRRRDLWNAVSIFGLKLRLLKIVNDFVVTTCDQQIPVLLCLDIIAAFDTVKYQLLFFRASCDFGVCVNVLNFLTVSCHRGHFARPINFFCVSHLLDLLNYSPLYESEADPGGHRDHVPPLPQAPP